MSAAVLDKIVHNDKNRHWVEAKIALPLSELIDMNCEELNDFAQKNILDDTEEVLCDIEYDVDSSDSNSNMIYIKVTADVDTK